MNWLKLTCCFLSPGCDTCQIARNITISRTQSKRVLCDCFTSTSVPWLRGPHRAFAATPSTYYVRCVTSRIGGDQRARGKKSTIAFFSAGAPLPLHSHGHGSVVGQGAEVLHDPRAQAHELRDELSPDAGSQVALVLVGRIEREGDSMAGDVPVDVQPAGPEHRPDAVPVERRKHGQAPRARSAQQTDEQGLGAV